MSAAGEDWKFWQWVIGGLISVVSGLIGGAWISRGVLEGLRHSAVDHERRLAIIEQQMTALSSMATNLAVLTAMHSEMKDDIKEIFKRCNRRYHDEPVGKDRRGE